MNKRIVTMLVLVGACAGLSACATTGEVEALRTRVDALESNVSATRADAAAARTTASDAVNTANQALDKANEANARSIDTETKIDRMFKRAMHK
ncbi:Lpp/OprI family alanine-zipper lipoprotein [Nitrosomonas sp.]|uniref:Lpp/OprI family alanine-zipper lipoprotein n=1 Tax=Nitrosomonas sp. TaxID=42353 RepID=UPI0025FD774D|nr:Lpp/OprI family alanine-zipper lipoprotein [Nitrosomonas sp.]MCC6916124.1 hypothetical protein [Nitrosomonas sp.]